MIRVLAIALGLSGVLFVSDAGHAKDLNFQIQVLTSEANVQGVRKPGTGVAVKKGGLRPRSARGPEIVSGPWGCRDCGFSNGTRLTGTEGLSGQASFAPVSITLKSGDRIDLR